MTGLPTDQQTEGSQGSYTFNSKELQEDLNRKRYIGMHIVRIFLTGEICKDIV